MGHRSQTHCKNGHAFTRENTYIARREARGNRKAHLFRRCRTCSLEASKEYDVFRRTSPKKRIAG